MVHRRNLADEFTTGLTLLCRGNSSVPLRNGGANDALFNDSEQEQKTLMDGVASIPPRLQWTKAPGNQLPSCDGCEYSRLKIRTS